MKNSFVLSIWGGGGKSRYCLCLALFISLFFASCNHKGKDESKKPNNNNDDGLKNLTPILFEIKGDNALDGSVVLKGASVTINENEVDLSFSEEDAPKGFICSEKFPITVQAGKDKVLTFQTPPSQKYAVWSKKVTVRCSTLDVLRIARFTVHRQDVKSDSSVSLEANLGKIIQDDVDLQFKQLDAPVLEFEGLPITLKEGETSSFRVYTNSTSKYEAFDQTVTVHVIKAKPTPKKRLNVKVFNVCGSPAGTGKVTVSADKDKIIKDDIDLQFMEDDAPKDFTFSSNPATMPTQGSKITLTISTTETDKYEVWSRKIEVARGKAENVDPTIDDCVDALRSQLAWAGLTVEGDISLPNIVTGYEGSSVVWTCDDEHVDASNGKIKKDIVDVTVELQANVTWKGDQKNVTFNVTVQRIKKIKWLKDYGKMIELEADFSKEGVLLFSRDKEPSREYEIKNIDVATKKITLKKTKDSMGRSSLFTPDEIVKMFGKMLGEVLDKLFGSKYIELENKTGISWEDLKAYLIDSKYAGISKDDSDDVIFEKFKKGTDGENYQGSFDEFKNLSPSERDKVVKAFLLKLKNDGALGVGLPENLPTQEFLTKIKDIYIKEFRIDAMHGAKEFSYRYTLEAKDNDPLFPDDYAIAIKSIYDPDRLWYDQLGSYRNDGNDMFLRSGEFNKEIGVTLVFYKSGSRLSSYPPIPVSSSTDFWLVGGTDIAGKKINCKISNIQADGSLTLSVEGEVAEAVGTYNLKFSSDDTIFY